MLDSISLALGTCAAADFLLGGSGVALLAYMYTHFAGFGINGMFFDIIAVLLLIGALALALPVAVLAVMTAARRRPRWVIAAWVVMVLLAAGAIYTLMYAPDQWRAWLAITGQSHPGTLRGTAVAGIALLLPLGALVYGFWQRIPSRWVPVGCVAAGALLAAGLVVTH
ncbi:MAG TPA: hypothetical protein VF116_05750 [Ktedonobacterales bacterium]